MKREKYTILIFGILLGLFSSLARLGTFGFFYLIGIISILVFGILHVKFLISIYKYFDLLKVSHKSSAWFGVLIYPFIFLFQFDLEEYKDACYVYEHITGKQTSYFEQYAFYIAIFSGLFYLINFIIWRMKLKKFVVRIT